MYFVNVTIRSPPFSLQESGEATFCIIFLFSYDMEWLILKHESYGTKHLPCSTPHRDC